MTLTITHLFSGMADGFNTPRDDKWIDIESELNCYEDATFYKGKIFAIREGGTLVVVDVRQDFKITVLNAPDHPHRGKEIVCRNYLMESAGDLLLVSRVSSVKRKRTSCFTEYRFHVHKLNESMKGWTRIENLGNRSIFIGGNHSISATICRLNGCRSNCIYYLEDSIVQNSTLGCQFDRGLFCLEDGHTERSPDEVLSFWYSPGFWCMQCLWRDFM